MSIHISCASLEVRGREKLFQSNKNNNFVLKYPEKGFRIGKKQIFWVVTYLMVSEVCWSFLRNCYCTLKISEKLEKHWMKDVK